MMKGLQNDATRVEGGLVMELRSELERKETLARSLQAQLDERRHIEEQTQARSERDLTASLAEASGLKRELERTSQLLMDGAVARHQLEQRCSALEQELEHCHVRAKEFEQEALEARVEVTKVSNELYSRRGNSFGDAEVAFAKEVNRVEANAQRETAALRDEAGALRAALEKKTSLYREVCSERNTARDEAEEAAETVRSLRQEVSIWRDRAEKLERLEHTVRTHEKKFHDEAQEAIKALKQNLVELQESLEMAREDAVTSRGVAAEESVKREEAEARLETMETEAKAGAEAARGISRERMEALKEEIRVKIEMMRVEMKADSDAAIREKLGPLLEEIRKSRREKAQLQRLVKKHSDRAKAIELENGRLLRGIDELHDSTMAIVRQAGINMAG